MWHRMKSKQRHINHSYFDALRHVITKYVLSCVQAFVQDGDYYTQSIQLFVVDTLYLSTNCTDPRLPPMDLLPFTPGTSPYILLASR
jgi:hypothetical protein